MLLLNVTHQPLDDVAMRRAMAFAINYKDIRELACLRLQRADLKPGIILPFGLEAKYYSEEDAKKYGASFDPEKAKATLKEAGYTPVWGPDGELIETRDAQGQQLPTMYIKSPTGWSDWESIVRIAVKSMREVGIDARERFVDASLFWTALFAGDFDLIMNTPSPNPRRRSPGPASRRVLTSQEWAPEGEKMYKNQGRFNNPKAPDYHPAHRRAARSHSDAQRRRRSSSDAYRELNRIFMQYQPTFPLVYRPDQFYEVSMRHWDNFPNSDEPLPPPQIPGDRLGTKMLWQLKPVGKLGSRACCGIILTMKHILGRAGWYFLTFLVAVTINFFLPRLGDANPIDTMMAKASAGLDTKSATEKEDAYLKEFGLVELDGQRRCFARRGGQAA